MYILYVDISMIYTKWHENMNMVEDVEYLLPVNCR